MSVVVDANLVVAIVLPLPYSAWATAKITAWKQQKIELLAPLLFEYEANSVLRKAVDASMLSTDTANDAMLKILSIGVRCFPPTRKLHARALQLAAQLGHSKSYDAHYMALAEQQQADMWTADRRLVHAAHQAGMPWLHWIGQEMTT